MRIVILTFILSIFLAGNICLAQTNASSKTKNQNKISLCNLSGPMVHIGNINSLMADGCDKIIFTDGGGKSLPLTKYIIAISHATGGNSYVEEVIGNKLSTTTKDKLSKLKVGDLIVLTQATNSNNTVTYRGGGANIMYKIVE